MLTISKKNGATSTAGGIAKKGDKGRLELSATRNGDVYGLSFKDYGNYGRERWQADFGELTELDIEDMIEALQELRAGALDDTAVEFTPPQPEPEAEAEPVAETIEDEQELSADDVQDVPAEITEEPGETDQLEA